MTGTRGTPPIPPGTDTILFNPFDPAFRANPYPFYDTLRDAAPVYFSPIQTVVLSRYEDVAVTLRSNDFSRDVEKNANAPTTPLSVRKRERSREGTKSILNLDPPDHTRLRRLVSQAFTPSAIERLRPRIQQLVDGALDRAAERGSMELIDDLAFPVPFQVISDLLAMPTERAAELRIWSQHLTASLEPTASDDDLDRSEAAIAQLAPYLRSIIEERRRNLGDDLLSSLIQAEESGDRMSIDELLTFVVLLYVAGHETTVNLIGNGALALLRNRDQLELWRDDPSLDAVAVDELLRFDGPVQLTVRVPLVPVTLGPEKGRVEIEPGTVVMTLLGAANHDGSMFDAPHSLQLQRPNANRHLAFAAGIHYCLGSSLAKLEAQVAIGSLIRRFPRLDLAGEPGWRDRLTIRGVDRLPLSVA
jgi:cytochrome P450